MSEKEYFKKLEEYDKEVNRLIGIIKKAIKYIEEELNCTPSSNRKEVGLILVDYKKLLKILKGEYDENKTN